MAITYTFAQILSLKITKKQSVVIAVILKCHNFVCQENPEICTNMVILWQKRLRKSHLVSALQYEMQLTTAGEMNVNCSAQTFATYGTASPYPIKLAHVFYLFAQTFA
ncbi:hypothetical protein [Silvimonas amylolytica]|uniref:hypothetical protein n=1 Tax=Silvimonas amylolytica TaxID=449663 RepID=UPI00166578AA|nr:hypothetical protein [Silvimonas amylolytica]